CGPSPRHRDRPHRDAAPDRGVLPGRVVRAVRPLPGRDGPPGGVPGPADSWRDQGIPGDRVGPAVRPGPGDAGRLDLRAGASRAGRHPVRDRTRSAGTAARGVPQRLRPFGGGPMSAPVLLGAIRRLVTMTLDGREIRVPEGSTILEALHSRGDADQADTPTLCWAPNLTPINACRVCVVELEGSRVLVPSCARTVEDGMRVRTDTERVRHSRRMVLELLASSVDLSQAGADVHRWMASYRVDPRRYGPPAAAASAGERARRPAGHPHLPDRATAAT